MEEKLVAYLEEKYRPSAIILHGSRAIGRERARSDWDFVILCDPVPDPPDFRAIVQEQNIEVMSLGTALADEAIVAETGTALQHARVVLDTDDRGARVMETARVHFAKGFAWPAGWPEGPNLFMASRIDGMRDHIDEPEIFLKHLGTFYARALNFWFQILHGEFSQPVYLALEIIAKRDPAYLSHLCMLASPDTTSREKISHAEALQGRIFG